MKTFVRWKWDSGVSQQREDLVTPSLNTQDSRRYSRSDFGCHSLLLTLLRAHLVYWHFLPRTLVYTFWSPDLSLLCSPHRKPSFSDSAYLHPTLAPVLLPYCFFSSIFFRQAQASQRLKIQFLFFFFFLHLLNACWTSRFVKWNETLFL